MRFFSISHNSHYKIGFPWVISLISGRTLVPACKTCRAPQWDIFGGIQVTLMPRKGKVWPDVLGCGAEPLFIVSGKVLEGWDKEGVGQFPHHCVEIVGKLPNGMSAAAKPDYYWIDGSKMAGAQLDFKASQFVGVKFCPACGTRTDNISATYRRQHAKPWGYKFVEGSWGGTNLFTTDLSPCAFFGTELLLECAAKYKLTNFRFIPVEEGDGIESKGIDYVKLYR